MGPLCAHHRGRGEAIRAAGDGDATVPRPNIETETTGDTPSTVHLTWAMFES